MNPDRIGLKLRTQIFVVVQPGLPCRAVAPAVPPARLPAPALTGREQCPAAWVRGPAPDPARVLAGAPAPVWASPGVPASLLTENCMLQPGEVCAPDAMPIAEAPASWHGPGGAGSRTTLRFGHGGLVITTSTRCASSYRTTATGFETFRARPCRRYEPGSPSSNNGVRCLRAGTRHSPTAQQRRTRLPTLWHRLPPPTEPSSVLFRVFSSVIDRLVSEDYLLQALVVASCEL